jgi:hypothetical protein
VKEKRLRLQKFLSVLIGSALLLGLMLPASADPPCRTYRGQTCTNVSVYVNGDRVQWADGGQSGPLLVNGQTFVPVRAVSEAMHLQVEYTNSNGRETVTLYGPDHHPDYGQGNITLEVGSTKVSVRWTRHSGSPVGEGYEDAFYLQAPVIKNVNGRILVPIRYVAEAAGFNVDWDSDTKTIYISDSFPSPGYPKPDPILFQQQTSSLLNRVTVSGGRYAPPPSDDWYGVSPAMLSALENAVNQTNDAFSLLSVNCCGGGAPLGVTSLRTGN